MAKVYDIKIAFELPELKFLFTEFFLKKLDKPLKTTVVISDAKKESAYKNLIYSSKWISITFFDNYFNNRFFRRNHIEFSDLIFKFFERLLTNPSVLNESKFFLKIIFNAKDGTKLCFLFEEVHSLNFLKVAFSEIIKKIQNYRNKDIKTVKEIKNSFKQKSKEVYFEFKNKNWVLINILFHAGKYHHDTIAKNIKDNRIAKPDILVNIEHLNDTIKYKALWKLEVNKRKFVRIKPNDIALYSNIAMINLKKAKEIYDNKNPSLWKYIQMQDEEKELMDYYEFIITSIILAFSAIEALVNIIIPGNYIYKKYEKNIKTGRMKTKKLSKQDIEWLSIDEKLNCVLTDALNIPLPKNEKWWTYFWKLKRLRDMIIHAVESKSNDRYSKLLEKEVFRIVESHMDVIKFFGKWLTDYKHYQLNEIPYGFGYDDIMPKLISS